MSTAIVPATGEVVELAERSPDELATMIDQAGDLLDAVHQFRQAVVDEVARRADARGKRTVELDGVTFEVNAPTEDVYDVGLLEAALAPLIADETIAAELVAELVVTPDPKPQPPRVDRRRVNALLKSDDRRLLAALAKARRRVPTKRTAKVTGRAVEATVVEEPGA
jgi:hypothetical protein